MKRIILMVILLSATISGLTQKIYDTFLVDGKKWNVTISNGNPVYDYDGYYQLLGDTVIGEKKCMKMYFFDSSYSTSPVYYWGMFEDEQRVYAAKAGTDKFFLMYDFGIKEGEWCDLSDKKAITAKVDTIEMNGLNVRRIVMLFLEKTDDGGYSNGGMSIYLSGIGCVRGHRFTIPVFGGADIVKTIEIVNSQTVRINETYVLNGIESATENIEKYILGIHSVSTEASLGGKEGALFDLQGRRLFTKPKKGVYIENGRKHVVR